MLRVAVPGTPEPPARGHLAMGEEPGPPDAITVDSRTLWRGGRPWFPVTGEFHYARYPAAEWREELLKVRAGGVTAVATYVFWNLHEERRGRFDWSGDRDLRRFVATCADAGLDAVVRIGPWAHGESRNGGFPDWLLAEDCVPRTDDPGYLDLVGAFFGQIGLQLRGLTRRDGGPVVAVQVENELHDQPGHLLTLKRMAKEAGIDAPLWTATGWGHARLPPAEVIPLFGGYAEAAWDTAHDGWPAQSRAHYFFGPGRDDDSIGADLRTTGGGGADEGHLAGYPFATCELGGGMYTSYHRRPIVAAADVAALSLVKLGSGSVWQGYYLYHGASQKIGELSTLQESHATGYPNDCPVINYDFQAPLGEFGQFRESYVRLRLQHLWLASDGADLAPMTLTMPPDAPADTADRRALRWSVRSDGRSGFLFVNNHQPVETLPAHEGVQFTVALGDRELVVPREPVTVPSGAYFVWPLVRPVGASTLLTASAQPVCALEGPAVVLAQVAGIPVELAFDAATVAAIDGPAMGGPPAAESGGEPVTVTTGGGATVVRGLRPGPGCLLRVTAADGSVAHVLVLDEESALTATRGRVRGADRLILSARPAVIDGDRLVLYGGAQAGGGRHAGDRLRVFPPLTAAGGAAHATSDRAAGGAAHPGTGHSTDGVFGTGHATDGVFGTGHSTDGVFGIVHLPDLDAEPTVAVVEQVAGAGPPRRTVVDANSGRASAPTDADFAGAAVYRVPVPAGLLDGGDEVLLRLDWSGDVGRAFIGGRLVADQFWHGPPWEIGLRRFRRDLLEHGAVELRLLPFPEDAPVYVSPQTRARKGTLELRSATFVPVPRTTLTV
ncbi:beta-galactosidase [Nonomuraea sp. NPDC049480]|uniref:beta-galactosidase n=1 Tax=Nonomuraea sp. NPDC049480 TaxID=3364353 RepID=UPI0037AD6E3E